MIDVFSASQRHTTDIGWLRSHPVFSFGEYQDASRNGFSVMRVCNDDYLAPGKGFGAHPHSDMEIVSIVLSGKIRHEDNLGNTVVTAYGEVQRMSAGSGIIHTEFNASDDEELRLLQLWFMPRTRGAEPSYEAKPFSVEKLHNALLPVVSNDEADAEAASIGQDMAIYLARLEAGKQLSYSAGSERKLFVYAIDGKLQVNEALLGAGDTAQLEDEAHLGIGASEDAFLMLIDLP